ncbi:MAG: O-antigen ligase family protein [Rhodospirillales bacterium]
MTNANKSGFSRISATVVVLLGILPAAIFFGRVIIGIVAGAAVAGIVLGEGFRTVWTRSRETVLSPLGLAIAATCLLWLPSLIASPDPVHSLETIVRSALFLIVAVVFYHYLAAEFHRPVLAIKSFLVVSIVGSCLALSAILYLPDIYLVTHLKAQLPPAIELAYKQTGSAAILMIPLACYAAWRLEGRWRWLAAAVTVALFGVMVVTGNRAGIAGVAGALPIVGLSVACRGRRWKLISLALVGFMVVTAMTLAWNQEQRVEMEVPAGTRTFMPDWIIDWHRQHIWITTWEIGAQHPWLGAGVNEIDSWPSARELIGKTTARSISFHPHNWILEIGAETGLISLAWMLGVVFVVNWKLLAHYHRGGSPAMLAAIAISAGYWISGLFNFSYWSSWWMVTFYSTMTIALALAAARRDGGPQAKTGA